MEVLKEVLSFRKVILVLITTLWLYWLWTRRSLYRFALTYPGCLGTPIFGAFHRIRSLKHVFPVFLQMFEACKRYTICIWLGLHPVLLTSDPEVIELVLSSPDLLNKANCIYQPLQSALKGGMIGSAVAEWKHSRKMIKPSFTHKVLLSYLPIFNKAKNYTVQQLDALADSGEHKLSKMLHGISLRTSLETTMGKLMEFDQLHTEYAESFSYIKKGIANQCLLMFLNLGGLFKLHFRFHKVKDMLYELVSQIIIGKLNGTTSKDTVQLQSQSKIKAESESELEHDDVPAIRKTPKIFIDKAIEIYQKQQFSVHDIIAESNTIVTASFETSANGILSVLVMLAMHPEVQERLFREIVSVYPDKDANMKYEDMAQLPYLNMVINEVLRLAPTIPLIGRQVVKDTQLSKHLFLPKDLQILISIYHLQRRTDIWGANADKFNPDNFLPENLSSKHSHAFMPFSKGVRNCLGWRYALIAMNVMLAGILRNYRLSTSFKYEDIEYVNNVALTFLVEPGIAIHRR